MSGKPSMVAVDITQVERFIDSHELTKQDIAEWAGCSTQTIYRMFKTGRTSPLTLDRLSCALGRHMSELML